MAAEPAAWHWLFLTLLLLALLPGPSDVLIVGCALSRGLVAAVLMVFGVILADALLIAVAIWGVYQLQSFLYQASAMLGLLAAAYLLFLAWGLVCRSPSTPLGAGLPESESSRFARPVRAGFLITLADPKALLFYFSLLPTFLSVDRSLWSQALLVLFVATIILLLVKLAYAVLAQRWATAWQRRGRQLPGPASMAMALSIVAGYLLGQVWQT